MLSAPHAISLSLSPLFLNSLVALSFVSVLPVSLLNILLCAFQRWRKNWGKKGWEALWVTFCRLQNYRPKQGRPGGRLKAKKPTRAWSQHTPEVRGNVVCHTSSCSALCMRQPETEEDAWIQREPREDMIETGPPTLWIFLLPWGVLVSLWIEESIIVAPNTFVAG